MKLLAVVSLVVVAIPTMGAVWQALAPPRGSGWDSLSRGATRGANALTNRNAVRRQPAPPALKRLLALVCVVVGPVIFVSHFTSKSGFAWDDFVNFRQAQLASLSLEFLVEPVFEHFSPGHRIGDSLIQDLFPLNFGVARAILLAAFGVSLLLFHRLLVELFRPGPGPLLLTLLYGLSEVHVGVVQWWASGLDVVPATLLSFVCILAYLRFHRTDDRRFLGLSVMALIVAVLFYSKPVLVPFYIVLLRVLILNPERPPAETLRETVREWRVWAAYALPVAVYLLVFLVNYANAVADASLPRLGRYLLALWFRVVGPGLMGVFLPPDRHSLGTVLTGVGVQVVLLALVGWSLARWTGAWRAWAFFAMTFLANALIVGLSRVLADEGAFGPTGLAYSARYNVEAAYLFPLALGAAFLQVRAGGIGRPEKRPAPVSRTRRAMVAVAGTAYLTLASLSAARISSAEYWVGVPARRYIERANLSLAGIGARVPTINILDANVPEFVVPPFLSPYNRLSEVLPLMEPDLRFDPEGPDPHQVAPDGTLMPVTYTVEAGGGAVQLLSRDVLAVLGAVSATNSGEELCVGSGPTVAFLQLSFPAPLGEGEWYLRLGHRSTRAGLAGLAVDRGAGFLPGQNLSVPIRRGPRAELAKLGEGGISGVLVSLPAQSTVCLDQLQLARVSRR